MGTSTDALPATRWPIVCCTGHRPDRLSPAMREWIPPELARVARRLREECGTEVGVSGMALGTDMWWAAALLDAGLKLWAHVPYPQQPDKWPEAEQREYRRLLALAMEVTTYGTEYNVALLHARNDGMLAASDAVIAVHRPTVRKGGTVSAVKKARARRLPMVHLNPDTQTVHLVYSPPIGASHV